MDTKKLSTFLILMVVLASVLYVYSGYIWINNIQFISSTEHWRFTYSLVGHLIAFTFFLSSIFALLYQKNFSSKQT